MTIERTRLLLGGAWQDPSTDATFEVRSPHDGRLVAVVPQAGPADVDAAARAAAAALDGPWAATSGAERAEVIRRLSLGLQARADELAGVITDEMGSPAKF